MIKILIDIIGDVVNLRRSPLQILVARPASDFNPDLFGGFGFVVVANMHDAVVTSGTMIFVHQFAAVTVGGIGGDAETKQERTLLAHRLDGPRY